MMLQGLFLRRKRFDFLRNSGSTGRASRARPVMDSSMFSGGMMMVVMIMMVVMMTEI